MFNLIKKIKVDKCAFFYINGNILAMNNINNTNNVNNIKNINIIKTNEKDKSNDFIIKNNKQNEKKYFHNFVTNYEKEEIYIKDFVTKERRRVHSFFSVLSKLFFNNSNYADVFSLIFCKNFSENFYVEGIKSYTYDLILRLLNGNFFSNFKSTVLSFEDFYVNLVFHNYSGYEDGYKEEINKSILNKKVETSIHLHFYEDHYFAGSFNLLEKEYNGIKKMILDFVKRYEFKKKKNNDYNSLKKIEEIPINENIPEKYYVLHIEETYNIKNIFRPYLDYTLNKSKNNEIKNEKIDENNNKNNINIEIFPKIIKLKDPYESSIYEDKLSKNKFNNKKFMYKNNKFEYNNNKINCNKINNIYNENTINIKEDEYINEDEYVNKDLYINKNECINNDDYINEDDYVNNYEYINDDEYINQNNENNYGKKNITKLMDYFKNDEDIDYEDIQDEDIDSSNNFLNKKRKNKKK